MNIRSFGITDRGRKRPANEDALFIDEVHGAYGVADGLGGLPGGAEASRRIVELLQWEFSGLSSPDAPVDLGKAVVGIHQMVAAESDAAHPFTGSGSTLTIVRILGDQCQICHVGDSAAFLLRGGSLEKLTVDHTMEQAFIQQMGEAAALHMPPEYPHTLTRCIGQEGELTVDQSRLTLENGDRMLLCTDGLNKVLSEAELVDGLGAPHSPEAIGRGFVDAANAREGPDNITLVVLHCGL